MVISKMKSEPNWLKIVILLEGLLCLFWVVSIPSDPKNAFILGFSKFRWLQILILFVGTISLSFTAKYLLKFLKSNLHKKLLKLVSVLSIILLLFLLSTPSYRLKPFTAEFERIRPLFTFGLLVLSNFYFFIKAEAGEIGWMDLKQLVGQSKKGILLSISLVFLFFSLYFLLKQFFPTQLRGDLLFAPPAPITALQLFSLVLFVWFLTQTKLGDLSNKKWIVLISGVIFAFAALLWIFLPMPCTNDLVGPYPPNYICYPPNHDAIYSIASHYGRLGAGIYNQWFTDKPLYIFFLMVTQWLSSPNIDQYIVVQVLFLSIIPVLIFLFTKKVHNIFSGILVAALFIFREANNISGYQMFGATNSRLESTEVFISLFLIIYGIVLFYWFRNKNNMVLAVLAGAVLGFTSLIRLNPVFIFPVTILSLLFLFKNNFKRGIIFSVIFSIGFLASFSPWYVFSSDPSGQNHLFLKLNEIIQSRYKPTGNIDDAIFTDFKNASPIPVYELTLEEISYPTRIGLHFINNNLQSFYTLPLEFSFHTLKYKAELPIWKDYSGYPSWYYPLGFQNVVFLIFYILIIISGVKVLYKKYGFASFAPLIVQIGYTFGNGVAITSGSRYLIPYIWVLYFYLSVGLVYLIGRTQETFKIRNNIINYELITKSISFSGQLSRKHKYLIFTVIIFSFIFSFGLTKLDLIPNKLDKAISNLTPHEFIASNDQLNKAIFDEIQGIESIELFYGYSFQPKYYRNNFYNSAPKSFELVTLTNEKVIVSYINDFQPHYFMDESETLIYGCTISKQNRWGAEFIIVDAIAIVQIDNEKNVYLSQFDEWTCPE